MVSFHLLQSIQIAIGRVTWRSGVQLEEGRLVDWNQSSRASQKSMTWTGWSPPTLDTISRWHSRIRSRCTRSSVQTLSQVLPSGKGFSTSTYPPSSIIRSHPSRGWIWAPFLLALEAQCCSIANGSARTT